MPPDQEGVNLRSTPMNFNPSNQRSSGFHRNTGIVARSPLPRIILMAWIIAGVVIAASLVLVASGPAAFAATDRVLVDGEDFPNGFTVPAGELWEFEAGADTKVTTSGNVVVLGTLRMRPTTGSVEHFLQFTGIDESKFEGGGHSHEDTPDDIGLWVEDAGVLDISGTPVTPWSYDWESDWSSGDDIVAAPVKAGVYATFSQVNKASDVPSANAFGYEPELLNLTRNVRIEGTAGGRTHILIHALDAKTPQTIEYAAIRYVAPTPDPDTGPFGGTDAVGRYGLHFHHNGYATAGSNVEGVVVRDAGNHAFVPHASHGVIFTNTIAYNTTDAAYWWDESTFDACGDVEGCNETFDLVYDSVVAADNVASEFNPHTSTAIALGGGENITIKDSVVVGMNGSSGANTSAYKWPSNDRGVWTFKNNIAHNNKGHGIFVWQNTPGDDDENHVIEAFTAYYNANAGIDHGAYGNAYVYKNITLLGNAADANGVEEDAAVHSHALGRKSATTTGVGATDTQEWNGVTTGGATMVVFFHGTDRDEVRFLFCDFSEIIFEEGPNSFRGAYDFIECDLDVGDFDRANIHPNTVIRVQDGSSAYQLVGTGSKKTISTFFDDPQPDPGGSGFTDIAGSIFAADIEWLAAEGITKGCNPPTNDLFCPLNKVTRGQMAAFLNRALSLPAGSGDPFVDDDDSIFENDIEALAAAGITKGCNPPTNDKFCPNAFVKRGQMAAFLNRALSLPAGSGDPFVDDDDSIFENDIEALAASGITKGCNPPTNDRFCPGSSVTRGQMAAFLHRAEPYLP
jgi:hypothetical protein